jgi:ATP-dependent helicase HrpA
VPDTAAALVADLSSAEGELLTVLARQLRQRHGVTVTAEDWPAADALDAHFRFNIRVLGEKQQVLAEGRDLLALKRQIRDQIHPSDGQQAKAAATTCEQMGLTDWPDADIPESVALTVKGMQSRAYAALTPGAGDTVDLRLFPTRREAEQAHARGLKHLFQRVCTPEFRQARKRVGDDKALLLEFSPWGNRLTLEDMFAAALSDHVFVAGQPLVYTRQSFAERLAADRPLLLAEAEHLAEVTARTYAGFTEVQVRLRSFDKPVFARALADARGQSAGLRPADFLITIPFERWQHYPRYLRALLLRLEKLPHNVPKDETATADMAQRWQDYETRRAQLAARDIRDSDVAALAEYRWLLEEYRVSLFAQTLKTAVPVSANRLDKLWAKIPK